MSRYRRRRGDAGDALKAAGVALGAGLGVAAVLFYLVWNWVRREAVAGGAAARGRGASERPDLDGEADPS